MPTTQPAEIRLNKPNELEVIIGHPPGWTLRWGMTVLLALTSVLIGISYFVSYPDLVEAATVITTENPPIRLVAGANAKIVSLNTSNGNFVEKGDIIGLLDNPANLEDVQTLDQFLDGITKNDAASYLAIDPPNGLSLGSIQGDFTLLVKTFEDLKFYLAQDANFLKINNLRQQIAEILNMEESLSRQIKLFDQELELHWKSVLRDSTLFQQNYTSELDFERTKTNYLLMKRQKEALHAGSANNRLEIQQLEAQIIDLKQLQSTSQSERLLALNEAIDRTLGSIADWKEKWLLEAPIAGEVVFTNAWSEQQFVNENEELLTIVPKNNAGEIIAKAVLTGPNAGKVLEGMQANIRLEGYPYQEYGQLNGTVGKIAIAPGKFGYECSILLPDGLVTSYSKDIPFLQEMKGTARIITEERNLLLRIFEKIRAAAEN